MSRAHPIGLRIASKKLNPSFIGVGQYYSYNQLKYSIVISKSIQQLSKQLAVPVHQIVDRSHSEKKSTKNLVLYPNILPMSVGLKAKQLFDSQYVINRRRLYSAAIYITRLLKQQFEKNYNDFTENTYTLPFSNDAKHKPPALNLPVVSFSKYQKWKSTRLKCCSLCPSITFARAFFRVSQRPSLSLYDIKRNLNTQDQKTYRKEKKAILLQQTKQSKNRNFLLPTKDPDPYLMLSYGVPRGLQSHLTAWQKLKEFYFLTKKTNVIINSPNFNFLTPSLKSNSNHSVSLLTLNRKTVPIFTLKKPKIKNLEVNNQTVSKTNNRISMFGLCLSKNANLNVKDQGIGSLKKHKSTNNLASTKPAFYSSFFQYLTYIKQNSINTFALCPEWPLPTSFSSTTTSINCTNWQKCLTPVVIKKKVKSVLKIKEQGKDTYLKVKRKDQKSPRNSMVALSPWSPCLKNRRFFDSQGPRGCFANSNKTEDFLRVKIKNQSGHWALRELCSKPVIDYQIIKRFTLLNYLSQLNPISSAVYQKLKFKKNHGPTIGIPLALAKEVENKQKRLYINSVPINKEEVPKALRAHKISYTLCPRSSVTILNLKSIKKLTKQIENFRSDIKLLAPLGLLLHRSFSEPVGINCISAVDNRLGKTYCNQFLKNLLFRRTSDNFLKSSYMNSQTGLLKAKNTILFDFAYTKDSLIKLGLKKTNTLMQQLLETGHTKLWLRKLSSVRL